MIRKMRCALVLLLVVVAVHVHGQVGCTFAIKGDSVSNEVLDKDGYLENARLAVVNTSGKPVYLAWETMANTFPAGWDCSMCQHGKCQIGIPSGSVFKKLDAGQEGFIAIHVLPGGISGAGSVQFRIFDKEQPDCSRTLTFYVKVR